jgi:predicted regulator of Ras-like GTPase activity (Roadblock/LC7/MglB family)
MSSNLMQTLARIPGVAHAVLLGKDGIPVNDTGSGAESLATQAVAIAAAGNRLGNLFGVGAMKRAAIQGKQSHLLVFEAKNHFLNVAVKGDSQFGAVEVEVCKALSPPK